MSTSKKIFRILRSSITKPLKLLIFFVIVGIEIVCLYKIRYSPLTYTFTRMSIHNYYLKGETNTKLIGIPRVNAASINEYADEIKIAFEYIDK